MVTPRIATAIALALTSALAPVSGSAAADDYRFELAGTPAKSGKTVVIKVRLVHVPDAKPVPDAVIFQQRFDMGPDGMAAMDAPIKALAPLEPGIYPFETEPQMGGNWALSLSAKVQGEPETVRGIVVLAVPK